MSTSMRPSVLVSAEHALPPPAITHEHAPAAADADTVRRRGRRYRLAMAGAVASALGAVAMLDRAISPRGPDALPLWTIGLVGLAAAVVSLLLGRAAFRVGPDAHDEADVAPLTPASPAALPPAGGDGVARR